MNPNHDEETKSLLPTDDAASVSAKTKVDTAKETWMAMTVSPRTVYLICFFILALNAGLLIASWRAQAEIVNLYAAMGRDVTNLPRPDPFAGLSEAAKSNSAGACFAICSRTW